MARQAASCEWWHSDGYFANFASGADVLLTNLYPHKDTRIIALGQSPAWLVRAAEILSEKRGEKRQYDYVAFTGRFYDRLDQPAQRNEEGNYEKAPDKTINAANQANYRNYLRSKRCDPKSLVEHFQTTGQKTVIMDYVGSGESLASFIGFLFAWAKEENVGKELKDSLSFRTLCEREPYLSKINIPSESISVECEPWPIYDDRTAPTFSEDDRIVPKYPHEKWNGPPVLENDPQVVASIETGLAKATERYLQEEQEAQADAEKRATEAEATRALRKEGLAALCTISLTPRAASGLEIHDSRITMPIIKALGIDAPTHDEQGHWIICTHELQTVRSAYEEAQQRLEELVTDPVKRATAAENITAQIETLRKALDRPRTLFSRG